VVARLDSWISDDGSPAQRERDLQTGRYFCHLAARRVRSNLHDLGDNLDAETTTLADLLTRD
jgi:hypothetical protein